MEKGKIVAFLITMLLISTAFSTVAIKIKELKENVSTVTESEPVSSYKLEIIADSSESSISNDLDVSIDASNPGELSLTNDVYNIYEGLYWRLYVTVYWDPPQGETICL